MAADKKISELPDATLPIATGVKFEALQGGINVKVDADDMPGSSGGTVTSVTGTTNRITSSGGATPVIDIDAAYDAAIVAAAVAAVPDADATTKGIAKLYSDVAAQNTDGAPDQNAVFDALALKADLAGSKVLIIACSDEVTPITATTNKVKFRMPYAMTLTAVRASLSTTQTSGSIFTVDINDGGTTILSTKLTIDNGETTSTTAATPAVISDTALADDAEISIDVDQIGDNTAKGLKVLLFGS